MDFFRGRIETGGGCDASSGECGMGVRGLGDLMAAVLLRRDGVLDEATSVELVFKLSSPKKKNNKEYVTQCFIYR